MENGFGSKEGRKEVKSQEEPVSEQLFGLSEMDKIDIKTHTHTAEQAVKLRPITGTDYLPLCPSRGNRGARGNLG